MQILQLLLYLILFPLIAALFILIVRKDSERNMDRRNFRDGDRYCISVLLVLGSDKGTLILFHRLGTDRPDDVFIEMVLIAVYPLSWYKVQEIADRGP